MNPILEQWNHLTPTDAAQAILPCNGSVAWAMGIAKARPLETPEALFASADKIWLALTPRDWQQAFDSHPRIGERKAKAASEQSLQWSAGEQSAAATDARIQAALARANQEYERKFGRIFIVCASGKTAVAMLGILNARLANEPATELHEAAEQQRQITQLRLRKWLNLAP